MSLPRTAIQGNLLNLAKDAESDRKGLVRGIYELKLIIPRLTRNLVKFSNELLHLHSVKQVYIVSNKPNGVLYIGVTNNLTRRVYEHKHHLVKGFTRQYNLEMLVWFEQTEDVNSAIAREKQLKNWHRQWKIDLIVKSNPTWQDLYDSIVG